MNDLVERLRKFTVDRGEPTMPINVHPAVCTEAADRIEALEAEIARLNDYLSRWPNLQGWRG